MLHGFLRGYSERSSACEVRGRRFFCSNRGKGRRGCGRTFSMLLAARLLGFVVTTATLFAVARLVVTGASRRQAWRHAASVSLSRGYRLWNRLLQAQTRLREALTELVPMPEFDPTDKPFPVARPRDAPLLATLLHCARVFPGADPLADFQHHFQTHLLRG